MCNGICQRYLVKRSNNKGRYDQGQKRCQSCAIWIKWDGLFCPCCNCRLRTKPRGKESKQRWIERSKQTEKPSKCLVCKKDFIQSHYNQKICGLKCKKIRQGKQRLAWQKRDPAKYEAIRKKYRQSEQGKATQKKYRQSEKGRATLKRWREAKK